MIRKYRLENTEDTYVRIWQKVNFGKEILKPDFFNRDKITESQESYRLSVYQFDPNTRLFYIGGTLYMVTSDEPIYNYLDTGRAVTFFKGNNYYTDTENGNSILYIYNDLIIMDKRIIDFEDYKDNRNLSLKELGVSDNLKVYLIFNEDLDKIKTRLSEIKAEEKQIESTDKQEEIKLEKERLVSLIRQYDKMTLLEDEDTIIKDNYFISKDEGFKVEFKDKVVKLFDKDELVTEDRSWNRVGFIVISYREFLQKLEHIYRLGKWEKPIEKKLKELNKKWLEFKIYSYDPDTKAEVFLKEIKIENIVKKGKLRFKINGVKMPIQKMSKVLDFIGAERRYGNDKVTTIERVTNLEKYLENIRLYSGTQLELLEGKTIEIKLNNVTIPLHFNIVAEDKDNWKIGIDNFVVERNYTDVKNTFKWLCGGGLVAISKICDTLKAGQELENILIGRVKGFVEKRRIAEEKAEKLFSEFLTKNKTSVFKKDGGYIIKGKLKNYIVKMKNEEDVGVWSYPNNEYVCINEKTKAGQYLCKYDKLLQFCMVMLNDGKLREEIHTIR
jgi:hypothetical protein